MKNNNNLKELLIQAAALIKAKEFDEAIPVYEAILEIDDENTKALTHLPVIFMMKKRFLEAVNMINKSFKVVKPEVSDYQNLATAYIELKDYNNAIKSYKKIIKINPKITEVYKLLGDAQMEIPDHHGAFESYKHALDLSPKNFDQLYDLGVVLEHLGGITDSMDLLTEAIEIKPNHVECNNRLASCLSANGEYKEANIIYKKLMEWLPESASVRVDYSSNLLYQGKYDEAEKIVTEMLIKNPTIHRAKLNLSFLHLHKKNFSEGWKYFDARLYVRNSIDKSVRFDIVKKNLDIDVDTKSLKASDKILILLDGGLGDVILGFSMLKAFHKKYSNISAEVDFRLISLAKRSFPDVQFYPISSHNHDILIKHNFSQFDKAIYWLSLGKYVRQDIESFPKKPIGFLKADTNNTNKIKNKLKRDKKIVCGISWKSSAVEGGHKSTKLESLVPILSNKGIKFLDLQYESEINFGQTAVEKENIKINRNIIIEEYQGIDKFMDIDGLSSLISNCDIIVTTSNVTAHLAGGLGIKTYLFVPFSRGRLWYWHDNNGVSIWYPSIRVFRAESPGEWGDIFEKIAKEMVQEVN
jgi:tetratricopeptide (TPR) repeat protein